MHEVFCRTPRVRVIERQDKDDTLLAIQRRVNSVCANRKHEHFSIIS